MAHDDTTQQDLDQINAMQASMEELEDVPSNATENATIGDIIAERLSRRDLMKNALAATTIAATIYPMATLAAYAKTPSTTPSFAFDEVSAGSSQTHHIARGHNADVLIRWVD